MATKKPIKAGSRYCRDCGGTVKEFLGQAWCLNNTKEGDAKEPKDYCDNLGKIRRRFCEYCSERVNGSVNCSKGHVPSNP